MLAYDVWHGLRTVLFTIHLFAWVGLETQTFFFSDEEVKERKEGVMQELQQQRREEEKEGREEGGEEKEEMLLEESWGSTGTGRFSLWSLSSSSSGSGAGSSSSSSSSSVKSRCVFFPLLAYSPPSKLPLPPPTFPPSLPLPFPLLRYSRLCVNERCPLRPHLEGNPISPLTLPPSLPFSPSLLLLQHAAFRLDK